VNDCGSLDNVINHLIDSGIGNNVTEKEVFDSWCDIILNVVRTDNNFVQIKINDVKRLSILKAVCGYVTNRSMTRGEIGEIHAEDAKNGALVPFVQNNIPCIIRKNLSSFRDNDIWNADVLAKQYGDTSITALVYDGQTKQASSDIKTVELPFNDFVHYSLNGFETDDTTMTQPQLYFLLTSRATVEGQDAAMNPNAAAGGPLQDMLESVPFDDKWLGPSTAEAWSNVRMGAGYDYPTHIDCFLNVLVQLKGRKSVVLHHPDSAKAWRPRKNHKHWPGTTPAERTSLYSKLLEKTLMGEVVLEEGDSIFIPSMYFHSVHVDTSSPDTSPWSVSANRYYYTGQAEEWLETNHASKTSGFRSYEETEMAGERVC
jgi:hypothetical protein